MGTSFKFSKLIVDTLVVNDQMNTNKDPSLQSLVLFMSIVIVGLFVWNMWLTSKIADPNA